jgi:hypothetical protein
MPLGSIKITFKKTIALIMTLIVIFAAAAFMMNMREPKLDFYWKNIEIEEENVFVITFPLNFQIDIPERIAEFSNGVERQVDLYVGSGKLLFDGREEKYFFMYITVPINDFKAGPKKSGWSRYTLAFMSNSSLLNMIAEDYGFPHLYVNVYAHQTINAFMNKTYLRFETIRGKTITEISVMIRVSGSQKTSLLEECLCYLNDQRLIALYLVGNSTTVTFQRYDREGAHVNATFTENSEILEYLNWNPYLFKTPIQFIYSMRRFNGRIGWAEWS